MPAHRKTLTLDAYGREEAYPDPPGDFDEELRAAWVSAWESVPASTWLSTDAPAVAQYLRLRRSVDRRLIDGEHVAGTDYARLGKLEEALLMSPKALRAAGYVVVGSEYDLDGNKAKPDEDEEYDW